ncbi:hypothetical protein OG689_34445 [Kitasatospora sp. NBC_00240]|uniref:hypothetical protein n=1 Tax=Kitasatospora sp. NBC_00240 TaxID=2903567 RepID=UPI0022560489|nr:hypothetical protein [Kitasatospora sp. NBC_00240]MCX5214305.1 hypothetical protein [Kitasatospora sp. NBC_00240]
MASDNAAEAPDPAGQDDRERILAALPFEELADRAAAAVVREIAGYRERDPEQVRADLLDVPGPCSPCRSARRYRRAQATGPAPRTAAQAEQAEQADELAVATGFYPARTGDALSLRPGRTPPGGQRKRRPLSPGAPPCTAATGRVAYSRARGP